MGGSMKPVRIKIWGIISLTRRQYLIQQAFVLAALLGLLVLWFYRSSLTASLRQGLLSLRSQGQPWLGAWLWLLDNLLWIVLTLAAWAVTEAVLVLRRFAREEAVRQAGPPGAAR